MQVLSIEDGCNRASLQLLLMPAGHQVSCITEEQVFAEMRSFEHYDAALLEVPDGCTFSSLRQLREIGFNVPIVTIFDGVSNLGVAALRAGADGYLSKPLKGQELLATLERLVALNGRCKHHFRQDQTVGKFGDSIVRAGMVIPTRAGRSHTSKLIEGMGAR